MKPLLVLCLGNDVLSDDAFGYRVGETIAQSNLTEYADVLTASVAGFALLDIFQGRNAVLIVDTVVTGNSMPGTLHYFPRGYWTPSRGLVSSHQISLPTALRFGTMMGYTIPDDIDILAVEASDVTTLSESMTASVASAVPEAAAMIAQWIHGKIDEVKHGPGNKEETVASGRAENLPGVQRSGMGG